MFEFDLIKKSSKARAWTFKTPHWEIKTPVFMPVWTKATVKWMTNDDIKEMWADIILANTYHLYMRPGDELVADFWWLHDFMNHNMPMLTDSWGFQVFSLWQGKWENMWVKITENWVQFRNHIDGSKHFFTPEKSMDIQANLWADIIMVFDECAPWKSNHKYAKEAMERTHRWAERSIKRWEENNKKRVEKWLHEQAIFPIVQWVTYKDLRLESAKFISNLDTKWIAIWGLSVWEAKKDMYEMLDLMDENLPENKPRYLMWIWTPEDIVEAVARWIDMFDCVLPTRLWRHWSAFWTYWRINIKSEKYKFDKSPLDEECDCKVCRNYTKWYLRHLVSEKEMLWSMLISYHNLYFLIKTANDCRNAVLEDRFEEYRKEFWSKMDKKYKK